MVKPYFSKKQKAQMKERRKKKMGQQAVSLTPSSFHNKEDPENEVLSSSTKKELEEEEGSALHPPSKKRQRDDEVDASSLSNLPTSSLDLATKIVNGKLLVTVPPGVSSAKDVKKFRKDARRQLRLGGTIDEATEIIFSNDQQNLESSSSSPPKKKKKKNFPSIQELLQEKKQLQVLQKEEAKEEKKLAKIPQEYKAKYIALDCEMVGIGADGKKSALARVSVVDWDLKVLLDTFVQVPTRVTDFRTQYSGVTSKHIKNKAGAMDVVTCRELVANLLKDKILVGHALSNDLKALLLTHPKASIRDTAKFRPFQRYANSKWRPRKLRDLVKENLKESSTKYAGFQEESHDSVQDASATMELFQLVHKQWEKELSSSHKK
jgi:RNA exonuclease 4